MHAVHPRRRHRRLVDGASRPDRHVGAAGVVPCRAVAALLPGCRGRMRRRPDHPHRRGPDADRLLAPAAVQEPAAATFLPAGAAGHGGGEAGLGGLRVRDHVAEVVDAARGRGAGEVGQAGRVVRAALGRGHAPHHAGLARRVHALAQCWLRGGGDVGEVVVGGVPAAATPVVRGRVRRGRSEAFQVEQVRARVAHRILVHHRRRHPGAARERHGRRRRREREPPGGHDAAVDLRLESGERRVASAPAWRRREEDVAGGGRERAAPRRHGDLHGFGGLLMIGCGSSWRRRVLRLIEDVALQALVDGGLGAEPCVEVRRRRRAPRLGRDVDGDRLPAGAGAVAAEQRPALARTTTAGSLPPAVVTLVVAPVHRAGAGRLVLPCGGRVGVGPGQQPGPAVPAGLGGRGGAAALAGHVRRRRDGQPRQQLMIRERWRGGEDDGGVASDYVGRAEVALGREDADLGAARPASRRAEVRPGPGPCGGEADRPRRRDPVPVHVSATVRHDLSLFVSR
uniref:Uncharacterized protein n=1 Tax=Setaria italica TaxID=4555 RepID=K3XGS9_SETIT